MNGTKLLRIEKPTIVLVAFAWLFLSVAGQPTKECDKSKCKGPLRFYEDLKCKPVYEKPEDCCAVRYDCSHLSGRSADKCYLNGREYAIGDMLKDEERPSPCDIGCRCIQGYSNVAMFSCAVVDCFRQFKKGCYFKHSPDSCCGGEEICPKNADEEPKITCEVDGQTYFEGQSFYPRDNPDLSCICMEGYKGENVKPFCKTPSCGVELRHGTDIRDNCIPVFENSQSPRTSCSFGYRCQNNQDAIISKETDGKTRSDKTSDDMKCKFGNMTMDIGDELNQATYYSSVCVKCTCEVPPTPTCQKLPDDVCDVTIHPSFENKYISFAEF